MEWNTKIAVFRHRMLDFLLKRPDDQTYIESVQWLSGALETIFSPSPFLLSDSSEDLYNSFFAGNKQGTGLVRHHLVGKLNAADVYFSLRTKEGERIPEEMEKLIERFLNSSYLHEKTYKEKQQQKQMIELTELFHSLMNKEDVGKKLMEKLESMYPDLSFSLLISHDQDQQMQIPAGVLNFKDAETDGTALDAYLSGEIKYESASSAYVPIKSLQVTYGVLFVSSKGDNELEYAKVSAIARITNAAGNAFENARLYEQSQTVIKNLQLINETSHQLNKSLRLTETMRDLSKRMIDYFEADEVGFFYIDQLGETKALPGSTYFFQTKEVLPYLQFVTTKLSEDQNGVFIGNGVSLFGEHGYGSLMSVPMLENSELRGYAIALKKPPYTFTFEMYKLFQSLIHHSTLAVTNSMLRDKLEHLVKTDQLTELYSRNYLEEKINYSMNSDKSGTFLLIDIDNFKQINDTYGHQTGDDILIQVAEVIHKNIRDHDVGARWGGEELAIYLPQAELTAGIKVAKRLIQAVKEGTKPSVTISVGVSSWSEKMKKPLKILFQDADEALYSAKRNGKNQLAASGFQE
jgi:diguanylate cyclase (GGDEF)-like protein